VDDFMIVDSPGMIDSPVSNTHHNNNNGNSQQAGGSKNPNAMDRGYNFEEVSESVSGWVVKYSTVQYTKVLCII
jgi:hypothetical protein